MTVRKSIGRNPLAPTQGGVAPGPGPLDVLIPKGAKTDQAGQSRSAAPEPQASAAIEPQASAAPEPQAAAAIVEPPPAETRPARERPSRPTAAEGPPVVAPRAEDTGGAPPVLSSGATVASLPAVPAATPVLSPGVPGPEPPAAGPHPAAGQHLVFQTGGEELAVSLRNVREIVEYGLVTRVPRMPPCIRGVTNLRGSIVPVVDLALRLGLPPREHTSRTSVVVVEANLGGKSAVVGLVADAVTAVRDLLPEDLSATPVLGGSVSVDAFSGLGRAADRLFLVLDTERVLARLDLGVRDAGRV